MSKIIFRAKQGFTLIELLIVVLIIAILAAIAVPNFLEFQTRAKVGRAMSDLRNFATGLEAYYVENDAYPNLELYRTLGADPCVCPPGPFQFNRGATYAVIHLSTPVAYLSSTAWWDPFMPQGTYDCLGELCTLIGGTKVPKSYTYINMDSYRELEAPALERSTAKWILLSFGPDQLRGPDPTGARQLSNYANGSPESPDTAHGGPDNFYYATSTYDPTNGTVSDGDILRFAGVSR